MSGHGGCPGGCWKWCDAPRRNACQDVGRAPYITSPSGARSRTDRPWYNGPVPPADDIGIGLDRSGDATVGTCAARAALAGNPSDGYRGAVVAIPVPTVAATVRYRRRDRFEIAHGPTPDDTFTDLDQLVDRVERFGYGDARALIVATLRALRRHVGARIEPGRLDAASTIPRSVGLAGSSAIVIATIRAVVTAHSTSTWAMRLAADPALTAAIALDAERRELGIAAGLQDRVVQAFDRPMFMDFESVTSLGEGLESGVYRPLPQPPGVVFVAVLHVAAEPSTIVHSSLRDDFEAGRGGTRRLMAEIADQARSAADAIERGDLDALGAAMDGTLELRRSLMVLDPRHLAMSEAAQSLGCHVNWSGSGGAVTVLAPNDTVATSARRALRDDLGCEVIEAVDAAG